MDDQYTYYKPRPCVSCEVAAFDTSGEVPEVLLVKRRYEPFQGMWAMPGGFLEVDEELESCAQRELYEETGVDVDESNLLQICAVGKIDRDPRDRIIAVVYTIVIEKFEHTLCAGDDAVEAAWFRLDALPKLAADHHTSMLKALGEVYHDRG